MIIFLFAKDENNMKEDLKTTTLLLHYTLIYFSTIFDELKEEEKLEIESSSIVIYFRENIGGNCLFEECTKIL